MRNLHIHKSFSNHIKYATNAVAFCCDSVGSVYIYYSGYVSTVKDTTVQEYINIGSYYNGEVPELIDMNISSVSGDFILVFKNGDILNIDPTSKIIECVGYVENGLQTVSWSPDEAVVALITETSSLILMTCMFDPVIEIDLNDNNFGEKQFVTVGWGKKETQFQGSEGKLTNTTGPPIVQTNSVDKRHTEISWRGDSQLFAVNTYNINSGHCIKIFTHDGILQYTSEVTPGLEGLLAWQPSGAIIASTQCLPNKYVVAFFEKNGLKHGEFSLPFMQNEKRVRHLAWNNESTVLALWWQNVTETESGILLFTRNNYHWYMKQAINLKNKKYVSMKWDTQYKNRLHLMYILQGVVYKYYDFKWAIDHSRCNKSHVAVIDGDSVLLTSFRHKVIPPPMCDQKVTMQAPVNQVLFPSHETDDCFLTVLADTSIARIEKCNEEWKVTRTYSSQVGDLFNYEQTVWVKDNILVNVNGKELVICEIGAQENTVTIKDTVPLEHLVLTLTAISENYILIQFENGNLCVLNIITKIMEPYFCNMPEPCVKVEVCKYNGSDLVIGLSEKMRFYINGNEIANNVTSFTLHSDFILFTTLQHKLYCAPMSTTTFKNLPSGRSVERGSRLVVAVPRDTRVILQMPRGNLESIHPRPLCLQVIADHLDKHDYESAFEKLRKNRISLNLICDHDPESFFSNVAHFVNSVRKQTWLSLFLSELVEEDVTQTMYVEFYQNVDRKHVAKENKVKRVCEAVRESLLSHECSDSYLLPILTSHVRQQTKEELAAALSRIKSIKEAENNMGSTRKELPVSSEEAIKHLLYLVDVNELYDVALGMYDFDLVLFVASKSQKDPKEYLPFLNELRKLEPSYQKYTIDKYLKRYESALIHISHCTNNKEKFEEMLSLVEEKKLYKEALSLFDRKSEEYIEIATLYAIYLESNKHNFDAGVMFQRVGKFTEAVRCFSGSGDWRLALIAASQNKYSSSEMQALCRHLAYNLADKRHFSDAAEILDQNLNDVEECVDVLVRGHLWSEAFSKSIIHDRTDLIETHVKPGVEQHFEQLSSQLSSGHTQFESYKTRLEVIRRAQQTALEDDDNNVGVPDSDLFSDTSSVVPSNLSSSASRSSGRSRTSSRRKRKQERKLLSLKEGSPYEDLALIRALHDLITNTDQLKEEVRNLCKMLLNFSKDAEARSLQHDLFSLMELIKSGISEIWSPEVVNAQPQTVFGPDSTVNSITANLQSEEIPVHRYALLEPRIRIPPVISSDTSWMLNILKN